MDSQATLRNKEWQITPTECGNSDCDRGVQSGSLAVVSPPAAESRDAPSSRDTEVFCPPALALFSQACAAYIDCDSVVPSEWQCNPPLLSMSDFAVDFPSQPSHAAVTDGKSVDAALPSLLNELEAFVASLRDEGHNDVF